MVRRGRFIAPINGPKGAWAYGFRSTRSFRVCPRVAAVREAVAAAHSISVLLSFAGIESSTFRYFLCKPDCCNMGYIMTSSLLHPTVPPTLHLLASLPRHPILTRRRPFTTSFRRVKEPHLQASGGGGEISLLLGGTMPPRAPTGRLQNADVRTSKFALKGARPRRVVRNAK